MTESPLPSGKALVGSVAFEQLLEKGMIITQPQKE